MNLLDQIRARAAADPQHIVLPEGEDDRTVRAAALIVADRLARITLLGREEVIRGKAARLGADLTGVAIIDQGRAPERERYAMRYHEIRRAKGVTLEEAHQQMDDPLYFGNMMVRE